MGLEKISQQLKSEIEDLISKFEAPLGHITALELILNGRINRSFKVTMINDDGFFSYMIQCINISVFKNPKELMANISLVTEHIARKGKETLHFRKVKNEFRTEKYGEYIYRDNSECWRISDFIESDVKNQVETESDLIALGEALGNFTAVLVDFDATKLNETIKDFHNTSIRLSRMINRVNAINFGEDDLLKRRCKDCREEIDFILKPERIVKAGIIMDAIKLKPILMRVSHNDPKLNNVLFDKDTGKVKCIIDLDTVMPGTVLFDFGDAVRYTCNTESEESERPDKVRLNLEYFKAFCKGFIPLARISENEIDMLVDSVWTMTYEQAIRFLDDHLAINNYFRVDYDGQNFERAKIQLALLSDIEKNYKKMKEIVSDIYWEEA